MDALSGVVNAASNAPKMLFYTTFDGMSINVGGTYAADSIDPSRNFYTPFSDTSDSTTGYDLSTDIKALFGSSTLVIIQSIPQQAILLADFGTYHSPDVSSGQITLTCDLRDFTGSPNPQSHLLISRSAAQALANDVNELCVVTYFKLPAGLDLQVGNTSTGKFFIPFEIKTGGYNNQAGVGDMRFKLQIDGTNGFNEYVCTVDDNANGNGIVPGVPASTTIFYRNFSGVTAALDTWTKFYLWWNRSAGRLTMAVEPDGGVFKVIGDVYPRDLQASVLNKTTLYGVQNLPITRMFFVSNYTSTNIPAPTIVKEIQLWNKPPIELV